jgi:hypothetical protein
VTAPDQSCAVEDLRLSIPQLGQVAHRRPSGASKATGLESRQTHGAWLPDRGSHHTGSLNPDPTRRWRCLDIDEIDDVTVTDHASRWVTADNYNPTRPFPAGVIDQLAIAVRPHRSPTAR